ncbi:hypothetical protein G9A89_020716 [Geosiphon pyriformis]|nr:hypothetical protein G9A89_020716 [Geosiphon pyriformis]
MPSFVVMEPVGSFAGGSGSVSAGLRPQSVVKNSKKKVHVDSVYFHSSSFKKPKKPETSGTIVDLSVGPVSAKTLQATSTEYGKFWGSKMKSEESSVSGVSEENLKNTITEETSYVDSNTFETDNMMNDATPRKTQMRTYVLGQLPKMPSFDALSDDNTELVLSVPKFSGSHKLPLVESHDRNKSKQLFGLEDDCQEDPSGSSQIGSGIIGTIAHDLSSLLELYGERTCFIGCNSSTYVHDRCAVICFGNEASKLAAIDTVLIFKGVNLHWAGLSLACCAACKQFGHVSGVCPVSKNSGSREKRVISDQDRVCLAGIYKKKQTSISHPVSFAGKTWAQVAGGSLSCVFSSVFSSAGVRSSSVSSSLISDPLVMSQLNDHLATLECSLEILADRVSGIVKKLSFVDLVLLASLCDGASSIVFVPAALGVSSDIVLDDRSTLSVLPFSGAGGSAVVLSSSGSKVLTSKVGGLESKMSAMKASIGAVLARLDFLCFNLDKFDGVRIFSLGLDKGFMGTGVAIIMNTFLAHHVSKVEEIPGRVVFVRLLFKGKLLVTVLGLYADASEINSLIAKAVNSSNFVVLDGDFNENGHSRSASFKFCLSLGLVNLFVVGKMIDYIFVGGNLSSAVAGHQVVSVSDFFDTDHRAVVVSVGLGGLLDVQLNSLHKQANRDRWKFKIKDVDCAGWAKFKNLFSTKLLSLGETFSGAKMRGDVDVMWAVLVKAVVDSADATFSRHWFSKFKCSKNVYSSRFFGLEILVAKIVKKFCSGDLSGTNRLMSKWLTLDDTKTCTFKDLVDLEVKSDVVVRHLSLVHRDYRRLKMFELRLAKEASVRKAIEKHMNNFCLDKGSIIRNVLERPFYKVVLNHLVVDNELVLLSGEVKSSMDKIMEGWTKKHSVQSYAPLDYVRDDAFSGVMCAISMGELLFVVGSLSDSKAAGLFGIPNELWKHSGERAWMSMILKPYDWDEVLMNTQPIALIETARKILFKVLFDHISVTCSKFDVLRSDNFLVLKGTSTQSLVFAVGSVIEDALKKNRELCLRHVKMCKRFIRFFGGIHEDRVNRVMTDFGLSNGYKVHNGLDQNERIFYNSLLCEVKRHEHLCGYWINTKFVLKTGKIESDGGLTSYFSAGVFGVKVASLSICGQPISIARKGEAHQYLGIFLSTEGLSKPSVVKAHADNVLVRKGLRFKACLLCDFSDAALHHPSLYGLKPFEQMQSEKKIAALIMFSNAPSILKYLFCHRFLDLQVLGWTLLDPLQFLVRLHVNPVNNFLARMVKIFLGNELSLVNNLSTVFRGPGCFPLSSILGKSLYFNLVKSLKCFGVTFGDQLFDKKDVLLDWKTFCHWKRLDPHSPVPHWFMVSSEFLKDQGYPFSGLVSSTEKLGLDILGSGEFSAVKDDLHDIWSGSFEVFTNGSLKNTGSAEVTCSAAAYFSVLDKSIGVAVYGLLSSTIAELQTVTLSLECVSSLSTVVLYLDSQAAIDAYVSEMSLATPNFCNQCWLEKQHIFNLVRDKDLSVSWVKVKGHSGIPGNVEANLATGAASGSPFSLFANVYKHFLVAEDVAVFGNAHHFIRDIFWSVCHAYWEDGPGCDVVLNAMIGCIDWVVTAKVWHPNLICLLGSLVCYPSVLCLLCGGVEFSDHAFTCVHEAGICGEILVETSAYWSALTSSSSISTVLQVLSQYSIDVRLYSLVCKGFVLREWFEEACSVLEDRKVATAQIVDYVRFVVGLHRTKVWLIRSSLQMIMEKTGLVCNSGVVFELSREVPSVLSDGVVRLLGVANFFAVSFGHRRPFCFFFGLGGSV